MKRVTPLLTLCSLLCLASLAAAESGAVWGVYGGDAANTRYSTLGKINTGNVQQLRVAWALQLGSVRSQESSPILVGDTLYVTSSFGPKNVFAVDAKTGTVRWRYSPDVPAGIFEEMDASGWIEEARSARAETSSRFAFTHMLSPETRLGSIVAKSSR